MAGAKAATLQFYEKMPVEAQLSLSYVAGRVPVSATPPAVVEAGRSWGLIITKDDEAIFTKFGDDMLRMIIAHKDAIVAKQEERARIEAGNAGGQYLDEINVFDLSKLKEDQFLTFIKRVTDTYMFYRLAKV